MKLPKMTNSQYIRALSDGDLARRLACPYDEMCHRSGANFISCNDCIKDWLRRPIKGTDIEWEDEDDD